MKTLRMMGGTAVGAIAATLVSVPVLAAPVGTQVGQTIENTVTVNYNIGTIAQDAETATDEVAVDRKVNLTLVRTDDSGAQVTPGQDDAAVTYVLTNETNDVLDFELVAINVAIGTASELSPSENDVFDTTGGFTFYLDNPSGGTVGVFDGTDTLITHIDALASGDSVIIHVVSEVPTGLDTDDRAAIQLTATARENDGAATLGAAFTVSASNDVDPMVVDTVFADGDADGQVAGDGSAFDTDDYYVLAAGITATKSSRIVAGAFAGDTTGTFLPGATIEYCILVSNSSGSATADSVTISDTLPAEVAYDSGYGVAVGGADCDTEGAGSGSEAGGVVTATIGSLAADEQQSVIFRAVID
jgi:uncharacterized repeat protein (TIGR01451 family)